MIDGPVIAGQYRIYQVLSVGGMGRLWLARDEQNGNTVVIKRPGEWNDEQGRSHRRFELEARTVASLSSRHIVRVLQYGVDSVGPFLVMEHLLGRDLGQLLATDGPWAPRRVLWALDQIEVALRLAHRRGIVHRDLKPSNIFLAEEAEVRLIKVLDFGIVKTAGVDWFSTQLTAAGTSVGSSGYMSPEQARGKPVDPRSDLWSLATILYELLTGVSAFAARHPGETLARLCEGAYAPTSEICPSLSPVFDPFFEKAFQLDPQDRFQDVCELTLAFRRAVGKKPSLALGMTKNKRSVSDETPTSPENTPFVDDREAPLARAFRAHATRTIALDSSSPTGGQEYEKPAPEQT